MDDDNATPWGLDEASEIPLEAWERRYGPLVPHDILTTTFGPIEDYMPQSPNHTDQFDAAMTKVTQDRGAVYGHPLDDFGRATALKEVLAECCDDEVRHALEMIAVKMARLVQTPDHLDSAIDIAGYARTICMVHDERAARAVPGVDAEPWPWWMNPAPVTSEWTPWHGGDCPVGPDTRVEVRFRSGRISTGAGWRWDHAGLNGDITAYRVVSE